MSKSKVILEECKYERKALCPVPSLPPPVPTEQYLSFLLFLLPYILFVTRSLSLSLSVPPFVLLSPPQDTFSVRLKFHVPVDLSLKQNKPRVFSDANKTIKFKIHK